jgi:hypothetical protein
VDNKRPTGTHALSSEAIRLFDEADFQWRRTGPTGRTIRAFGIREDALRRFPGGAGYNDPWAFGDRVAWDAAKPEGDRQTLEVICALTAHLAPVTTPGQPIHGDILPNVLVADGLPPAVIDWPVYFRPVAMANAIAVTDALTFRGAPLALLDEWETGEDWNQMLIRALLYRLGATGLIASRNRLMGSLVTHVERVRSVVDEVLSCR